MNTPPTLSVEIDKNINILLVDDTPTNLMALEEMLEKEGRTFFKATSGNEALKIALSNPIGLILLDVQMPDMDGFEVAHLLKSNSTTQDIAIIFVTAYSKGEELMMRGYGEGAADYLYKPLDTKVTCAKVNVFETLYYQRQELKNSYKEISKINRQLDRFVYVVSHDLKAPLRGISMLADFIKEELGDIQNPTLQEYLTTMKDRVSQMGNLITGILEYSRLGRTKGVKEFLNANELLISIIELLAPPSNIKINIQKGLPTIEADKIKLQQVFQNLISNAIKYNDKPEGIIDITCAEKRNFYSFTVGDNGPGIEPKFHEKVFELFQTIQKQDAESTGIGLSIVKDIVEDAGGKITLVSSKGSGARFTFDWPKSI